MTRREYLYLCGAGLSAAQPDAILERWQQIAATTDGTLGAAALHLGTGRQVSLHGDERFPLASVCKLPCAMHILALVDEGKLTRTAQIEVIKQDVSLDVSDVGHRWPKPRRFPLDELLLLMVAKSDNTAVETLYRIGGGPAAINARLQSWHLDAIRIDRTEHQCGIDWKKSIRGFIADPRDTGTPDGTIQLLRRLFRGELLSPASTARLIEILQATSTGLARIKGMLPRGIIVAHKTGTTGTVGGLNGSTNDVGVINGHLALAVYLKGSAHDLDAREAIIARVAQAAFNALG
jgi:beta-lactamase class A